MRLRTTLLLGALGLPALAAFPGAAPAQIDLGACRYLTHHRPAPDVDYVPGVDAQGRAVVPADLPGSAAVAPVQRLDIPLTVGIARRLGYPVPSGGLPPGAEIGTLTLDRDRLYFNGQPLGAAREAQLYALCRAPG
ncbi:hypothetical protein [Azospirillum sp. SYSU D00513]|uniref:hypothetical protein n=1 Tax=Azospirillum sp. SYSU D00513 TaxID=2812561 RepID=UPI001A966B24|nr:hypothetical protein [Azospirillum sp. SYSU D00513]